MAQVRRATVNWTGNLSAGAGELSAETSRAFTGLPVSWASRTEESNGKTSPEELLAAAHASCFSMSLSSELTKAGSPPESLKVTSEINFDRVDGRWTVVSSTLIVHAHVHGIDDAGFQAIAELSKDNCPISRALKGNVALAVQATLEQ